MSKFDHKKVMPRYSAIAIIMTLIAIAIVGKALYIMTAKHDYWMKVAERQKRDSVTVKPNRGNILSCTGQLMASSLPEFKVFMDFKALTDSRATTRFGMPSRTPSAWASTRYSRRRAQRNSSAIS